MQPETTPSAAFKSGDLATAIQLSAQEVKRHPKEPQYRAFLAELCCMAGDYERADQQLQTLLTLNPDLLLTINTWRQLIRSAYARRNTYENASAPDLLAGSSPAVESALSLLLAKINGDAETVQDILANREQQTESPTFTVNGASENSLRDLDDINAFVFEFLSPNGDYYWVDALHIEKLTLSKPKRTLDLLWRECDLTLTNGKSGTLFLPTIYPEVIDDNTALLGRSTHWQNHYGCEVGVGLREFLVGEHCFAVFDLESLEQVSV